MTAFFRNRSVNLLNLHSGLHAIVLSGGGAFFTVYLLRSGVSIPRVFLSIALILLGRFLIRPLVIVAAVRWGLRSVLIAGTLLSALQYPLLAEVHGVGIALAALIALAAVGDTLYWTTYHAYFAVLGDNELRGQQIGAREAIGAVVSIASPLLAGWLIVGFGPRVAFGVTATIQALAALPFLWTPDVTVRRQAPGALKAAVPGVLLFMCDAWVAVGFWIVWQIALFVTLGENFIAYGSALAVAAFVGAIGSLTLGRHIDAGRGRQAVWFALGAVALILVLRAVAIGDPALAVLANAVGGFGVCLYIPTLMAPVYSMAKRSPCTLRFHIATEGGWDLGGAGALLTAALATASGAPLSAGVLQSLAGVAAIVMLLRRQYATGPAAAITADS
jgi:MFS transporter, DHA1 family, inner membrane transport protein